MPVQGSDCRPIGVIDCLAAIPSTFWEPTQRPGRRPSRAPEPCSPHSRWTANRPAQLQCRRSPDLALHNAAALAWPLHGGAPYRCRRRSDGIQTTQALVEPQPAAACTHSGGRFRLLAGPRQLRLRQRQMPPPLRQRTRIPAPPLTGSWALHWLAAPSKHIMQWSLRKGRPSSR